ncbi:MAG: hypothetical protein JO023_17290, partial [Chloroflexi bacterium]|nr:hypothetical protein [Chloroflexota bacterium]
QPVGGPAPTAQVWRDIDPLKASQNVYFVLDPTDETAVKEDERVLLGIWTTHIALLFGRELGNADVQTIYPRSQEGQAR